ncbi:unnamed protein product [Closterium sp. Naga37s-1]|nr:unnamed protein product [Closterium sp. Naga37s-1]
MRRIPVAVWRAIAVLRAVLPRGSWWDLQQLAGGKAARGKGASGDSSGKGSGGGDSPGELWDAIRKLWRDARWHVLCMLPFPVLHHTPHASLLPLMSFHPCSPSPPHGLSPPPHTASSPPSLLPYPFLPTSSPPRITWARASSHIRPQYRLIFCLLLSEVTLFPFFPPTSDWKFPPSLPPPSSSPSPSHRFHTPTSVRHQLSEVTIPHFLAATIFAASNGLKPQFDRNVHLLITMTLACGLFRCVRNAVPTDNLSDTDLPSSPLRSSHSCLFLPSSGLRAASFTILNLQMVRRMRLALYETLIRQDIAFFDGQSVGDLTSRLGSDCQAAGHTVAIDLNIMLRNALQGIGAFVFLIRLSWQMALVTAALCGLMWYLLMVYGSFSRRSSMVVQDTVAAANEVAEETLSLARVVRTFGTESKEVKRYEVPLQRIVNVGLRRSVAYGVWTCTGNTIYNTTQVLALIMGGGAVMAGRITAEQLTQFILYAEWVVHATWWVGDHWASLMDSVGACHRVFQLLDLPPSEQLTQNHGRVLPSLKGKLEFRNLSFRYPTRPEAPVLDHINLTIQPGELVALVGLSGSGKSTLVGLLQRLYEPTEGQVLIDDVPLPEIDIAWLRSHIGVVSQEPRLFSTDVASNIAYGSREEISQEKITRAATQANVHQFVSGLPEGYDTVVDNARLSGGQKQRIAIARALVRDPTLLILDEATSALDAESEHYVQMALDQAMHDDSAMGRRKRTIIVIAHRLSTIRSADRIVVMSAGKIVESHDQRMIIHLIHRKQPGAEPPLAGASACGGATIVTAAAHECADRQRVRRLLQSLLDECAAELLPAVDAAGEAQAQAHAAERDGGAVHNGAAATAVEEPNVLLSERKKQQLEKLGQRLRSLIASHRGAVPPRPVLMLYPGAPKRFLTRAPEPPPWEGGAGEAADEEGRRVLACGRTRLQKELAELDENEDDDNEDDAFVFNVAGRVAEGGTHGGLRGAANGGAGNGDAGNGGAGNGGAGNGGAGNGGAGNGGAGNGGAGNGGAGNGGAGNGGAGNGAVERVEDERKTREKAASSATVAAGGGGKKEQPLQAPASADAHAPLRPPQPQQQLHGQQKQQQKQQLVLQPQQEEGEEGGEEKTEQQELAQPGAQQADSAGGSGWTSPLASADFSWAAHMAPDGLLGSIASAVAAVASGSSTPPSPSPQGNTSTLPPAHPAPSTPPPTPTPGSAAFPPRPATLTTPAPTITSASPGPANPSGLFQSGINVIYESAVAFSTEYTNTMRTLTHTTSATNANWSTQFSNMVTAAAIAAGTLASGPAVSGDVSGAASGGAAGDAAVGSNRGANTAFHAARAGLGGDPTALGNAGLPPAHGRPRDGKVRGRVGDVAPSGLTWEEEIASQLASVGVAVSSWGPGEEVRAERGGDGGGGGVGGGGRGVGGNGEAAAMASNGVSLAAAKVGTGAASERENTAPPAAPSAAYPTARSGGSRARTQSMVGLVGGGRAAAGAKGADGGVGGRATLGINVGRAGHNRAASVAASVAGAPPPSPGSGNKFGGFGLGSFFSKGWRKAFNLE